MGSSDRVPAARWRSQIGTFLAVGGAIAAVVWSVNNNGDDADIVAPTPFATLIVRATSAVPTATPTPDPVIAEFAMELEIRVVWAVIPTAEDTTYRSLGECQAYAAMRESSQTDSAKEKEALFAQTMLRMGLIAAGPCDSFGVRDVHPVNQAHAIWSRTMDTCDTDSYWTCVRVNASFLTEVLDTYRPDWSLPLAKTHLSLFEAAYRLARFGTDENPDAPALVTALEDAWEEWFDVWTTP